MMRTTWWTVVVVLSVAAVGLAGDANASGEKPPTLEQLQMHERSLELQARENEIAFEEKARGSELAHEAKLRDLEIQQREAELNRMRGGGGGGAAALLLLVTLVAHILLTVWVCKDMREQEIGRALWVPIILLTGVFGAILYAIARHTDIQAKAAPKAASRRGG
jgi:hypothetical protein